MVMKALSKYHLNRLREAIRQDYARFASDPTQVFPHQYGREYAISLGYDADKLSRYAGSSVESFTGVGMPLAIRDLELGQTVVDIGAGAGTDSLLAAAEVGSVGFVFGIEMVEELIEKARHQARKSRLNNLAFTNAFAERLPVPSTSADVVISNGVINLCPDKHLVFNEIYRVLKPGGRIQIADVIAKKSQEGKDLSATQSPDRQSYELLAIRLSSALTSDEYAKLLGDVGFTAIWIGDFKDVFNGQLQNHKSAGEGLLGAHIYAEKPK